nr:purine-nucleoside phosphorylase [Bacteroidales bacterium]
MYERIQQSSEFLKNLRSSLPDVGIILGSGLGDLANQIEQAQVIPYSEIPNFPVSTVAGHKGNLVFGVLGGKQVVVMQGRFHYYEGYGMKEVTFPVRVMKALGVKTLILSNAAGGVNPDFSVGDIMLIKDHVNLFPENPLRGPNDERLGTRFPDMSEAYSKRLRNLAKDIARRDGLLLREGAYLGWQGPSFETPTEYGLVRLLGCDACGMSTVPEVIVARHAQMEVFALSVITNCAIGQDIAEVSHEEVQVAAKLAQQNMTHLVTELIKSL